MRQLIYRFVCFASAAGLMASEPMSCDAVARQPLNLRAFETAAKAYASLLSQPEAASKFLICLQKQNLGLAETLMLYQRRLQLPAQADAEVEGAFLHYVINTREPLLADEETADLRRLGRSYSESLVLTAEPDDQRHWTLPDLRRFGQKANARRYGRGDIVPVGLLDFTESSTGYSTLNAVWMSEMSALAYWDPVLMDKQMRQWGCKLIAVITDAGTDTSGFLAAKDNHLVLSFRGTSSLKNFNTDAQILKIPAVWAEGNIHHGFAGALAAVWPQITQSLGMPGEQQKELWVTGHSLGAALAQLAALRLTKLGYRVRAVYTFGTPRVGDSGFVADYDKLLGDRTFPHINDRDVVTRVPPFSLGFRAAASKQIRQFSGAGHQMIPFKETPDGPETASNWRSGAIESIRNTTEFLPAFLRPQSLQLMPSAGRPLSIYSATFQQGALDEHGSFEYLFKLVCEALEQDLWPIEAKQANVGPFKVHHD